MMKTRIVLKATCVVLFFFAPQSKAQAPLPAADMAKVCSAVEEMFGSVDEIHTVGMADDQNGRFDIIVIGSQPRNDGWRVVVFSVERHRLSTRWDSVAMAKAREFLSSGSKSVKVYIRDYDYDVVIEGCAPHQCSDGVSGFLVFSGRSSETSQAKVVTQDLAKSEVKAPKYDVTFSTNIGRLAKQRLIEAICGSRSINNKSGLPFACTKP